MWVQVPSLAPRKKHLRKQVLFSTKSVLADGINPPVVDEITFVMKSDFVGMMTDFISSAKQISSVHCTDFIARCAISLSCQKLEAPPRSFELFLCSFIFLKRSYFFFLRRRMVIPPAARRTARMPSVIQRAGEVFPPERESSVSEETEGAEEASSFF